MKLQVETRTFNIFPYLEQNIHGDFWQKAEVSPPSTPSCRWRCVLVLVILIVKMNWRVHI
jgi:hypothetical protein